MIKYLRMTLQWTELTNVDPPAVSLHQQQNKHMQWNKIDDENITTPCRDLQQIEQEIRSENICKFLGQPMLDILMVWQENTKPTNMSTQNYY